MERELDCFAEAPGLPLLAVPAAGVPALLARLPGPQAAFAHASGFVGAPGSMVLLPDAAGLAGAVLGLGAGSGAAATLHAFGALPDQLPDGVWQLGEGVADPQLAALGWALGAYRFGALRRPAQGARPRLVLPAEAAFVLSTARATWLARDLINTPANLLGPAELAQTAASVLARRGAAIEVVAGEAVRRRYPAIAAVGAGSARPPCVLVARWHAPAARADAPLISLCGKGVCFDTGGYDIKPSAGMLRMKKDMGGAAIVLGLACMIIEAELPVRLECRLGCAENMISGGAMRPSDAIGTRAGLHVEVANTDAEGRLVLCDLLTEACEARPGMLLDFATLTGAARVALGPDLPALFTNDEALGALFTHAGAAMGDDVWRLPLWEGYNSWLDSGTSDLTNVSDKPFAGAIVAGLFLQRFVSAGIPWAHFDVYAWNDTTRAGRPAGGEAQAMRAAFEGVARFART